MYTATIDSKDFTKGVFQIVVIYTNGTDKFTETYQLRGISDAQNAIINRLSQLNSVDLSQIKLGTFTPPVSSIPLPPNQAQLDQATFLVDLGQFKQMQTAISLGLKTINDKDFTDLQTKLKSEFLPAYVNLL